MMQGLPTPPTDNLYKFLAIGGLALAIGCLLAFSMSIKAEMDWYSASSDRILQRRHDTLPSKVTAKEDIDDLWKEDNRIFGAQIKERAVMIHAVVPLIAFGIVAGIVMALFGFVLWWYRIQKYQDALLRFEYEIAKLNYDREHVRITASSGLAS